MRFSGPCVAAYYTATRLGSCPASGTLVVIGSGESATGTGTVTCPAVALTNCEAVAFTYHAGTDHAERKRQPDRAGHRDSDWLRTDSQSHDYVRRNEGATRGL